jgi:hypothetical protein
MRYTLAIQQHFVSHQGFLKRRGHEHIPGSRFDEDSKVNIEKREIDNERHEN